MEEVLEYELPEFDSKSLSDYLEWEFEVDRCIGDFPHSSCRLDAIVARKLAGYARIRWLVHMKRRAFVGYSERVSWDYIKGTMKKIFVPPCYKKGQCEKLVLLTQGSMSVKEYAYVFKKLVKHCELDKPTLLVIFRFVRGLNQDVSNNLRSCDYLTLEEAVWEASRAERSLAYAKEEERIKQL